MSDRTYTKDQAIIVERILKHKSHEYYKILEVETSASENEIKKAYRKLSLKVHPDKNSHPKADESFKRVAKAFEVLGDSSKRRIYDQTGSDPDSRGSSGSSTNGFGNAGAFNNQFFQQGSPFAFGGGHPQGFNGFQFQQGGDLFDILFGNSGSFGGTTFTFGGPGHGGASPFGFQQRTHNPRARANPQQRQQAPPQDQTLLESLKQFLPVILVLLIPIISNFFSDSQESFQLHKQSPYIYERTTSHYHIPYYVTEKQQKTLTKEKISKIDREAERSYISIVRDNCRRESNFKERQIQDAYGWFFTDEEKLQQAQNIPLPNCERLSQLGLNLL